jgi:prevent-host-death family protein
LASETISASVPDWPVCLALLAREILAVDTDDGVVFESDRLTTELIREEDVYAGVRITVPARIDRAQHPLRIDINVGDPVTPAAAEIGCHVTRLRAARRCFVADADIPPRRDRRSSRTSSVGSTSSWRLRARKFADWRLTRDTVTAVSEVSIRELRNHGGEVIDRVAAGERVTVTRDGRAVAELRPLGRTALPAQVLRRRWSRLPPMDPDAFRRDLDRVLDPTL